MKKPRKTGTVPRSARSAVQSPFSPKPVTSGLRLALETLRSAITITDEDREKFKSRPWDLLSKYGFLFPVVILKLFKDIYTEKVRRAVVCAPRGGGKTFIAAALAFAVWFFLGWNVVIVAGSREQALRAIEYISALLGQPEIKDYVGDETKTLITGKGGNWIKACPASTKAIRGIHARGRKILLIIDEEAEVEATVLRSALNVVRDAKFSTILRLSTYHKVVGSFADLVDNHRQLGYTLYKFDSFDVCARCKDKCDDCFAAYAANRPDAAALTAEFRDMYCTGRGHKGEGWLQIPEIRQARVEQNREWFETENMGWKPSGEGMVLPPDKVKAAFEAVAALRPTANSERWFCIDWGFKGMTAVNLLERVGEDVNHLASREFSLTTFPLILENLQQMAEEFETHTVYADVSHPFENTQLGEAGFEVTPVAFVAYKETGAGWLRYLFERGLFHSSAVFGKVKKQLLGWRRNASGQIVKKDDHHCDSLLAGTKKLDENFGGRITVGQFPFASDSDEVALDRLLDSSDRDLDRLLGSSHGS